MGNVSSPDVIGKTASCAAMALTFAAYVAPAGWERPVAAGAALAYAARLDAVAAGALKRPRRKAPIGKIR